MSVSHGRRRYQYAGTLGLTHIHLITLSTVTTLGRMGVARHDTRQPRTLSPRNG